MRSFYDSYCTEINNKNIITSYTSVNGSLYDTFELLFYVMISISTFIVLFATLFYAALKKSEFVYNNRFISVFEYSGYSKKSVINSFILLNILDLIKLYAIAFAASLILTNSVNLLNSIFHFANFRIFSYNPIIISAFLLFMLGTMIISVNILFRKVRTVSWYDNIIAARDLL